ncbi:carbohydrate ABC transporter permease [Salinibacterium sp. G-O1]|uniref:carbohydrate ABC transporter permease n=1 Tax=Salinibacterium sp. G-O1 TaxID=3046208 RepID=UPI0024B8C47D|nr:carbohydrate ABC transporter permease [Salinibacterium sp. G-O1]MDJ0336085.1 carbohydrate ABC transporter permease [Salinibacterium sp. G-O1]
MKRIRGAGVAYTVGAAMIILIMLFPLYWMFNTSVQQASDLFRIPPSWFPSVPNWAGYESAFRVQGASIATSVVVALGVVLLTLAIAAPAAYALAQFKLRGGMAVSIVILVVQLIPGIVMANALYSIFSQLGVLDNLFVLILADSTASVPFAVIIITAFMSTLPPALIEAAEVDGASRFRVFWSIVLPLSRNALVTAGLFAFLSGWGDFLFAVTLNSGGKFVPLTVGLYQFIGVNATDWNAVMATAVISSIPAIVLLVFAQRFISAGVTAGSVK